MKYALLSAAAVSLVLSASVARADEETDQLRAQIKALEERLDQLEKRQYQQGQAAAPAAAPATAAQPANGSLQNRVAIVERKQEIDEEAAKTQADNTAKVEIGSKGLIVTSPDKQYSVNLHGYVQADDREFLDRVPGASGNTDTFLIRSARPIIDARMTDYFDARFMMDFGRGASTLLDAYGDFHPMPGTDYFSVRAGEFKVPVGIERLQNEQDVLFVERGQTTNLVPYRDIGVMAHGQIIPNQLEYQLGITNGAADLQANTGDTDSDKDLVGRVFAYPFRWAQMPMLQGVGLGVGGTYGVHQGNATTPDLTAGYVTVGQRTYFSYLTTGGDAYANGPQWRFNPQAMYYNGSFGSFGEYVLNGQEIARNGNDAVLKNRAWMGTASYVLTGEDAAFDGVHPAHNFNPQAGDWGAFEIVGRLSDLDVAANAFPNFASYATSSKSAFERTIGGTWYFNNSVKLNADFAYTTFGAGAPGGLDHKDEKAVLTRMQFKF